MNPFVLEELFIPMLLLFGFILWIWFNHSKKFEKGVVKQVKFKPETPDADATGGDGSNKEESGK